MKDAYFDYDEENHHLTTVSAMPQTKDEAGQDMLLITGIQTSRAGRNQGRARKLLQFVLDQADKEHVILMLAVDPDPGIDRDRLVQWYERVGFKFVQDGDPTMKRLPQSKQDYILLPKTGSQLSVHLEMEHGYDTVMHNVHQLQSAHRRMHLDNVIWNHVHTRPKKGS